jgi:hypothetical protein
MKRKRGWIIVAAAVVVLAGVGYWWFYPYWKAYHGYTPLTFSKEGWASADAEARGVAGSGVGLPAPRSTENRLGACPPAAAA